MFTVHGRETGDGAHREDPQEGVAICSFGGMIETAVVSNLPATYFLFRILFPFGLVATQLNRSQHSKHGLRSFRCAQKRPKARVLFANTGGKCVHSPLGSRFLFGSLADREPPERIVVFVLSFEAPNFLV